MAVKVMSTNIKLQFAMIAGVIEELGKALIIGRPQIFSVVMFRLITMYLIQNKLICGWLSTSSLFLLLKAQ